MITKRMRITALEIIKHNFILFFVELALRFRGGILLSVIFILYFNFYHISINYIVKQS